MKVYYLFYCILGKMGMRGSCVRIVGLLTLWLFKCYPIFDNTAGQVRGGEGRREKEEGGGGRNEALCWLVCSLAHC